MSSSLRATRKSAQESFCRAGVDRPTDTFADEERARLHLHIRKCVWSVCCRLERAGLSASGGGGQRLCKDEMGSLTHFLGYFRREGDAHSPNLLLAFFFGKVLHHVWCFSASRKRLRNENDKPARPYTHFIHFFFRREKEVDKKVLSVDARRLLPRRISFCRRKKGGGGGDASVRQHQEVLLVQRGHLRGGGEQQAEDRDLRSRGRRVLGDWIGHWVPIGKNANP